MKPTYYYIYWDANTWLPFYLNSKSGLASWDPPDDPKTIINPRTGEVAIAIPHPVAPVQTGFVEAERLIQRLQSGPTVTDVLGDVFSKGNKGWLADLSLPGESLSEQLVATIPKSLASKAIALDKLVWRHLVKQPESSVCSQLYSILERDEGLIHEAYAQALRFLICRSDGDESRARICRTLDLFLFLSTCFPPRSPLDACVKSALARFRCASSRERLCVFLSLVRIESGNKLGLKKEDADSVVKWSVEGRFQFGVPLAEQMFFQLASDPHLLIPKVFHESCEALLSAGGDHTEGVFRRPGLLIKVEDKIREYEDLFKTPDRAVALLAHQTVNDIASLIKRWVRDIPGQLLSEAAVRKLKHSMPKADVIALAESLPQFQRDVLAYLVGFLRRLQLGEEETRMGLDNLAMTFAPNILYMDFIKDPMMTATTISHGQSFLVSLCRDWDVADIYPVVLPV